MEVPPLPSGHKSEKIQAMHETLPQEKEAIFRHAFEMARREGFQVTASDASRPWGGFLVLDEAQAPRFAERYFAEIPLEEIVTGRKLSPKFLVVAPGQRLSWQYHFRRAELWKVLEGPVAVAISDTDQQGEPGIYPAGEVIRLRQGERHRLIGLDTWGIVAEIWQHSDAAHPSDEDDIVRLQDDYGR